MDKDINYDSFGFIVIGLMHTSVGYTMGLRSRQVLQLSPQVYPNVRPASASPSVLLISISRIPFLLLISSYGSSSTSQSTGSFLRLRFYHADCLLSRSSFSYSFIFAFVPFLLPDPLSADFLPSRFVTRCYA